MSRTDNTYLYTIVGEHGWPLFGAGTSLPRALAEAVRYGRLPVELALEAMACGDNATMNADSGSARIETDRGVCTVRYERWEKDTP